LLLFVLNDGNRDDETWVYDLSDNTWTLKSPATKPSARNSHAMASLGGGQALLFGGFDGAADDETWVYTASTSCTPTSAPVFANCTDNSETYLGCNPAIIPGADPGVTASDNCGAVTVLSSVTNEVNARLITYTASNSVGSDTCTQIYTWSTAAPTIDTQPVAQTACVGASRSFSVVSNVPLPQYNYGRTYQWRKGGVNLTNGGNISGATSPTLTINSISLANAGSYDVVVSNGCGSTPSNAVALTITPTVTCPANSSVSATATPFSLTGGSPTGGTYSGPGVSSGIFNPAAAGIGTHTIQYSYTDANDCSNSCSFQITVTGGGCGVTINPATLPQPYLAVPYARILSATPSGNYTFSVSAGQLPPGLQLVTVLGVSSIAGIPAAPGTYNFTIKAKKKNSTCEATRSYTVTIPATVLPILNCVQRNQNGTYTARFGYDNSTGAAVTIPVGSSNYFTPGNQNRGQTTIFQPGSVTNAFSVTFTKGKNSNLAIWYLRGPDGVLRPVNVLTTSIGCP
jgi:hypothetical protein